ncbi:MAG: hypothetical protein AB8B80_13500 [Marinicellaceae bacterium]
MIIQLTHIKLILLIIFFISSLDINAKSTSYSFDYITDNSEFIGSIKITNKIRVTASNDFFCGYQYDFNIVSSERDNSVNHKFWSMLDDFNKSDEYLIF